MREPTEQCQGIIKTLKDVLTGGKTPTLKTMGDRNVIPREETTTVLITRTEVELKTIEEITPLEMAIGVTIALGVEVLPLTGSSTPSATFALSQ